MLPQLSELFHQHRAAFVSAQLSLFLFQMASDALQSATLYVATLHPEPFKVPVILKMRFPVNVEITVLYIHTYNGNIIYCLYALSFIHLCFSNVFGATKCLLHLRSMVDSFMCEK